MNILVCVKQVPDIGMHNTLEVSLSDDLTLRRDSAAQILNPADESALELALRLRDTHSGEVTVLTMGPERAGGMLRELLGRGADRAVHMTDKRFAGSDTLMTAQFLARAARYLGGFDLILCGRRAADGETGQVGPMLAQMLGRVCVTNVTGAEMNGGSLVVRQLVESGTVSWDVPFPAVLTLCEWSCRLRLPTLMGLRRARTAPITRLTADDLDVTEAGFAASPTRVVKVHTKPQGIRPCQKLSMADALAALAERGVLG